MTCDEESKSAKAKQTKNPLKITVFSSPLPSKK